MSGGRVRWMMTLRQFSRRPASIPSAIAWTLADLAEARGRQDLFTRQSPQKLKALRENALIESAVSSNRIEGVSVDQARVRTLILGRPTPRDRDEEEVQGYRTALKEIHERAAKMPISERTVLRLHRLSRGETWDAGRYKQRDVDIIETFAGGGSRIRFKSVPAARTPPAMAELVALWNRTIKERWVHPLIALAGFNLDFLCIHPFRDGNGRVSRLLLLLQCYRLGYEIGRYISIERLIEQYKERYYETLEQCSHGWHEGKHAPWPYIGYLLFVLREAYKEFERRVEHTKSPRGAKTEFVTAAIARRDAPFRVGELQRDCPGVSLDMIRRVLKDLQQNGRVRCLTLGRDAAWNRVGQWK
jgi:Fic family protein